MGVRNFESTAQAVIALAAAGRTEKAEEAARQLAEYRRPDGGYAHLPDGDTNRMATAQTLEAFTALALSQRGEGLFSALPAVSPGLSSQDGSADIDVSADSQSPAIRRMGTRRNQSFPARRSHQPPLNRHMASPEPTSSL